MSTDDKTRIVSASEGVGPGTQLNGIFEIDEHIAFGGMGEVYRGHNIQTDDPVAIKIVLPEFARDKTMLALFRKEASILSHLANDAIVRYHVFTIDPAIGRPYLAMEYVDGVSLADLIARGPMEAETVRRLIARIASGLSAAHAAGVIHRDLSPDNVILPGGKVEKAKIIDFGIAKSATVGGGTVLGGKFAGKYNFVSPEQLGDFGGEVTNRSDVYSLGLVMAAALRGEALDMGGSQVDVIEKRRKMPDVSNLDPTLRPILEAMLRPNPDNRPPSMDAVVQWLSGPAQALPGVPPRYGDQAAAQPTYLPGDNPAWQNLPVPGERSAAPSGSTPPLSGGSVRPTSVVPGAAASGGSVPPAGSIAPLSPSGSVAPVSESPFGAYRPQAPAPAWTPPHAAQQSAPAKKSRAALYAATVVVLVALVGGAAYMSGMLDSPSATSTDAPADPPTLEAATDVAPPLSKPADTASGLSDTTPPPEASAQPEAPPPAAAASTEAPPVAATSTEASTEAKAEPPPAAEAPKEEAKAEAPPPSEPAKSAAPAEEKIAVVVPEVSPPPPPPPAETLDTAATRVAWLNDYGGGNCFYATATNVSDNAIEIEGFGTSAAPFETMLAEFKKTHKIEPEIGMRLIEQKQCAVTDFLQALRNSSADRPELSLSSDTIKSGQALRGTLGNLKGRKTDVLLVDNAGVVYNLASHLKQAKEKASFNIKLGLATQAPVPQIIIALTSPKGLDTAKVKNPVLAETLFPKILEEINSKKVTASATAKYFKLGG